MPRSSTCSTLAAGSVDWQEPLLVWPAKLCPSPFISWPPCCFTLEAINFIVMCFCFVLCNKRSIQAVLQQRS